jgi:hypothetical protein
MREIDLAKSPALKGSDILPSVRCKISLNAEIFMVNLKIQFLDFPESDSVWNAVWDHVADLEKICDQMMSCHVVISKPHRRLHQGAIYHVKIRMHIPGRDIIVDRESEKDHAHEDVYIALRDAFAAATRQVEDFVEARRAHASRSRDRNIEFNLPTDESGSTA